MSTAFAITPATVADVPGITNTFLQAFASERLNEMLPPTPEVRAWLERGYENFVRGEAGRHQSRFFVLRGEDGKTVVGYALYCIIDAKDGGLQPWDERYPPLVAGLDGEKLGGFFTTMENNHRKVMGQEGHIFLESIAISESLRGKGLAAKMLELGKEMADALDYPSYLDATKLAVTLYERAGYVVQDTGLPSRSVPMRRPRKSEREAKI